MDRGPPEPKRMRSEYHQLHSPIAYDSATRYDVERALPTPLGPPPPPAELPRRHSSQYDDPSRSYNGYPPRDTVMKQESSLEQRPHLDGMRPHSTGHHPLHRRPGDDMRPPYDHHSMSNGSTSTTRTYISAPYSDRPYFAEPPPPIGEGPREQIGYPIEITTSSSSTQKKRSARTTQACEACRHAKAKCTDPKPCQGCVEKGIDCKYDPPPPKQSDKASSEVTTQIDNLRELFMKESQRHRDEKRKEQERQSLQDRKLDAILKVMARFDPNINSEMETGNHVPMKSEEDDGNASVQPSIEGGDDSDEIDDQVQREISIRGTVARQQSELSPPVDTTYISELAFNIVPAPKEFYGSGDTFGDAAPASKNDKSPIPLRHTTGSHYVLQWPSVIKLWKGALIKPESVEKFDPYAMEIRRGILHLHGTGEGYELGSMAWEKHPRGTTASSSSSEGAESAPSPTVEKSWGMIGASPVPEPQVAGRFNPLDLKPDRSPPFDEKTVRHLAGVYMNTFNIMHPIITKRGIDQIIDLFLKEISTGKRSQDDNMSASFAGTGKRKRDSPYTHTILSDDTRLPYTMSTATMLLILALGRICDHKQALPAPPTRADAPALGSPPSITFSQSPSPALRSPTLPRKKRVRSSASGTLSQDQSAKPAGPQYLPGVKNVDVIPGLAYFALAANILGDHEGEYTLQMVQACLLAGLYQGQLARPLQSYSYIYRAGVCLQWVLPRSKREYYKKRPRTETHITIEGTEAHEWITHRKRTENHTLFLFWTCLQLESDILAELDCPVRSGILELEGDMPWPHTDVALLDGDMDALATQCYMTQLQYRTHLNTMHKDLYGPGNTHRYSPEKLTDSDYVTKQLVNEIEALAVNLNSWVTVGSLVQWDEETLPADNILEARLRGKYYGAQNITYRHFLRAVLDSDAGESFPEKVMEYAKMCVKAMKKSCLAFTRCTKPGERLIVTNCWGTAHAQWGNTIVLHAVFSSPLFEGCITRDELVLITTRVRRFLADVVQYGSAIEMDLRFLDAVAKETNILDEVLLRMRDESYSLMASFSSGTS